MSTPEEDEEDEEDERREDECFEEDLRREEEEEEEGMWDKIFSNPEKSISWMRRGVGISLISSPNSSLSLSMARLERVPTTILTTFLLIWEERRGERAVAVQFSRKLGWDWGRKEIDQRTKQHSYTN